MIRRSFLPLVGLLLWTAAPVQAQSEVEPTQKPFLWRVEGPDQAKPSFVFGTIHIPDDRVLALSPVVEEALDACDRFYTEIPMDMATQMSGMQLMQLPGGKTLKDVLPEATYKKADAYLQSKGYQLMMFARFKPWVVMSQLELLDFMKDMMAGKEALDAMLYKREQQKGKKVGGLETMQEQVAAFDAFTLEEQVKLLDSTLDRLAEKKPEDEDKSPVEPLVLAYLSGDLAQIQKMADDENGEYDEAIKAKFEKSLITDRNVRMADRMAANMKEHPEDSHFFAVGTMHYPGDQGVLKLLEERGFTVTRLTPADAGSLMPEPAGAGAGH